MRITLPPPALHFRKMAGHTLSSYLVLLVVLSAAVLHCNSESGKTGGEYCSEDAKLSSKFLVPFYESHLSVSRD